MTPSWWRIRRKRPPLTREGLAQLDVSHLPALLRAYDATWDVIEEYGRQRRQAIYELGLLGERIHQLDPTFDPTYREDTNEKDR